MKLVSRIQSWLSHEKTYPNGSTFKRGETIAFTILSLALSTLLTVGTVAFLKWDFSAIRASYVFDTTHPMTDILQKDMDFIKYLLLFGAVGVVLNVWVKRRKARCLKRIP